MKPYFKYNPSYPQIEREFIQLDQRLAHIMQVAQVIAWERWKSNILITRVVEPNPNAVGKFKTHLNQKFPFRFIDFVIESGDSEQDKIHQMEQLRRVINILFPYGVDAYETIPPLDHGGNALHCHAQIKP